MKNFLSLKSATVGIILCITVVVILFIGDNLWWKYEVKRMADQPGTMYICPDGTVQDVGPNACKKDSQETKKSALFSVNKDSGSSPLTVQFSVSYMGLGTHWIDFGDGQREYVVCSEFKPETDRCVSFNQTFYHTYTKIGIYTARYIEEVIGTSGKTETVIKTIAVQVK